ncbi:transcription factor EGL1 isoform X2 [Populus alba]|uniref:transcription factor EGL1 isoform X2 n=1 Tax=Populus alba TaxID=43335 RepID=UPI00158BFBDD|nr:transcription factor EGL1-like isoform X2 [Populus alba]
MAHVVQSQQATLEKLRKQLAVAVRSVQWSYAIFWSLSTRQKGVLEWGDGYYNGDIKTRKVQATELKADKIGLQRSEQLRELYKSLLGGDDGQQAKRSSPALSPEDLSDEEWYYLVCMSFVFNPGEGLPGRALASKQTIWLCNAQYADSKVFSRSLLAKSASIQTVVCFPYLEGVMELGVTELVTEDPSLIQHIKASLLDFSKPDCSEKSPSAAHNGDDDEDPMSTKISHEIVDSLALENLYTPTDDIELEQEGINDLHGNLHEEFKRNSPDDCSDGCEYNHQTGDSMHEGLNGGVSQVQSWHFMDDEFSDDVLDSMNSSECISEAVVKQGKAVLSSKEKNVTRLQSQVFQEGNHTKLSSFDLGGDDDLHYRRIMCVILKSSSQSIENPCFQSGDHKSSFFSWKKRAVDGLMPRVQQNMLKKILFSVPLIYGGHSRRFEKESGGTDCLKKLEGCETCKEHYKSDKQRVKDKFIALRSMVPTISEIDKESILSDTINYLKQLESRVAELESFKGWIDHEAGHRRSYMDMGDQTSDNDDIKRIDNGKRSWVNKRKALDIDEAKLELDGVSPQDGMPLDLKVCTKEKEVLIEIRCPYREYMLLDLMDEINKLQLDVHSVQSSTLDGIFALTLKSKFRGAAVAPAGMIKQALRKIAGKT